MGSVHEYGSLSDLSTSWERHLRPEVSPRTLESYLRAVTQFAAYLEIQGRTTQIGAITRTEVADFVTHLLETRSSSTAATRYSGLRAFFRWAVDEGEIDSSPMAQMSPPRIEEVPVPVPAVAEIEALLAACRGQTFAGRRDTALIGMFIDTGARLAEITNLTLEDLDFTYGVAVVAGKGGRSRAVPLSTDVIKDLDRYLRARRRRSLGDEPALWLGRKGQLTRSGILQLIKRRSREAGIDPPLYPQSASPFLRSCVVSCRRRRRRPYAARWMALQGDAGTLRSVSGRRTSQGRSHKVLAAAPNQEETMKLLVRYRCDHQGCGRTMAEVFEHPTDDGRLLVQPIGRSITGLEDHDLRKPLWGSATDAISIGDPTTWPILSLIRGPPLTCDKHSRLDYQIDYAELEQKVRQARDTYQLIEIMLSADGETESRLDRTLAARKSATMHSACGKKRETK